jgi:hypothetical protein
LAHQKKVKMERNASNHLDPALQTGSIAWMISQRSKRAIVPDAGPIALYCFSWFSSRFPFHIPLQPHKSVLGLA